MSRHSDNEALIGQWTPYAQDLYDLLIATFSNGQRGLADLEALQSTSGLSSIEFVDLLQYTAQVSFLAMIYRRGILISWFLGIKQSCQLQILRLYKDHSTRQL